MAKQGNAGEQPDANRGLNAEPSGRSLPVFKFSGKPNADKLQGFGDRVTKVLSNEPVCEKYHNLTISHAPIPSRHSPFFSYFQNREVHHFADCIVGWQGGFGL